MLNAIFKIADDNGMLLLDMKDLRAMAQHCAENSATYQTQYGNISTASVGAIQRALLQLETEGGDILFGEPALNLEDMMQTDAKGLGFINILAADKLLNSPRVYATLLLWILSELFEKLPEVGDMEKPKLVFFFDEAHLLFNDAPAILMQKIEQVVRLVRSKGVGVYFVSQNPLDIPDVVLGQLGNRVQHALRAFTPRDQKAVQVAAQTFRANPKLNVATAITELGVGEALVSFLDEKGAPTPVERVFVCPPESRVGPATDAERKQVMAQSLVAGDNFYDQISALHKSVRGSHPDAALYWLTRMLDGGADPRYLSRRIVRMAWEDIGLADPRAMQIANDAALTYERLGSPEGELALGQAVIYLAVAAKSNAGYMAYNQAKAFVRQDKSREVPVHLRNAPTKLMKELGYGHEYRYAHDEPNAYAAGETYLPDGLIEPGWYQPTPRGLESKIGEKLAMLRKWDDEANKK